jgi:cytochrome c553
MKATLVLCLFAALACGQAHAGDAARGKEKSAACAACHGADGNSQAPDFPKIAGQHEDYLYHTLVDYKSGKRKNAIMQGQVANLSKEDLADIAAYFARQQGLYTKR